MSEILAANRLPLTEMIERYRNGEKTLDASIAHRAGPRVLHLLEEEKRLLRKIAAAGQHGVTEIGSMEALADVGKEILWRIAE